MDDNQVPAIIAIHLLGKVFAEHKG